MVRADQRQLGVVRVQLVCVQAIAGVVLLNTLGLVCVGQRAPESCSAGMGLRSAAAPSSLMPPVHMPAMVSGSLRSMSSGSPAPGRSPMLGAASHALLCEPPCDAH